MIGTYVSYTTVRYFKSFELVIDAKPVIFHPLHLLISKTVPYLKIDNCSFFGAAYAPSTSFFILGSHSLSLVPIALQIRSARSEKDNNFSYKYR